MGEDGQQVTGSSVKMNEEKSAGGISCDSWRWLQQARSAALN